MSIRLACAVALGGLLAGCAALVPPTAPPSPAVARAPRPYFDAIDMAGRLSVQYNRGGTEEYLHGSFTWSQTPQRTVLTLLSPLGQTLAVIDVQPGSAILTQANQPPRMAPDADALVQAALGWPLPVSGLRDWLQGFVTDTQGQSRMVPAEPGSTASTANGWHIVYASWQQDDASGRAHPRRIDLARQTVEAGPVKLRIVIDNWQTLSAL
jgi:outer membrane lipoprotein LolB